MEYCPVRRLGGSDSRWHLGDWECVTLLAWVWLVGYLSVKGKTVLLESGGPCDMDAVWPLASHQCIFLLFFTLVLVKVFLLMDNCSIRKSSCQHDEINHLKNTILYIYHMENCIYNNMVIVAENIMWQIRVFTTFSFI